MKKLGVNIDHVATLRNARGEKHPDPVVIAKHAISLGADSITIHLREDRRHIRDIDLKKILKKIKIPLNLEMAPTKEMLKIALRYKPNYVCIVPEKRRELTTEGGLNLKKNISFLKFAISCLKKSEIRVSLFINPNIKDINYAKRLGADCIELHTGRYCNLFNQNKSTNKIFLNLKRASHYGQKIGLEIHAGHGLTNKSINKISKIKYISELNIGHFIISEAIFVGLEKSIKKFKKILGNKK